MECMRSCALFGDDRILVVLNGSDKPKTFAMPIGEYAWRIDPARRLDRWRGQEDRRKRGGDRSGTVRRQDHADTLRAGNEDL